MSLSVQSIINDPKAVDCHSKGIVAFVEGTMDFT